MKNKIYLTAGIMLGLFNSSLAQQVQVNDNVASLLAGISANDIKAHITYLADDKLKGRLPGTEGYQLAVDYVTAQLKASNIEPGGENGTYLQKVRIRKASATATDFSITENGSTDQLLVNKDYVLYPHLEEKNVSVSAPVVFAGYGITIPQLKYDDYSNIDVKGKIVLVLRGAPKSFDPHVALNQSSVTSILANAAKHGAVGVVVFSTTPGLRPVKTVNSTILPNGKIASSGSYVSAAIKLFSTFSTDRVNTLFKNAGLDTATVFAQIQNGVPASKTLNATIKATYTSEYNDVESYNILGKITGSDSKLKKEYVLHTAHLDHVGIGPAIEGDSIYNGAHDNASGVAALIEIGKVYAKLEKKPKRSIIIGFVTGEEMGLLGSGYFAKSPTVNKKSIVADINTDMPTIIAPFLSAVPIGAEHSSLTKYVNKAGEYLHIDIEKDPEPEQNRFVRSDQYSFVKEGIPALHVKYGNKTADGLNNLDVKVKQWRAKYYHKPQDDINGIFDFEAGKSYSQFNFLISYFIAQDDSRPVWNNDSPFNKPVK